MSDTPEPQARPPVRLLTAACILALTGLAVSVAHMLWPTPLLFTLFMLVGQSSFAVAMLLYAIVILRDLRARRVL